MTDKAANKDENAKNPDFVTPMKLSGVAPEDYRTTGSSGGTPPNGGMTEGKTK